MELLEMLIIIPFIGTAWLILIYFIYYILREIFDLKKKLEKHVYEQGIHKGMTIANGVVYSVIHQHFQPSEKSDLVYCEYLERLNKHRR